MYITEGLTAAFTVGKLSLNLSDRPQFNVAFIPTNFNKPSKDKCSLFFIKAIACLNSR
ncbi:hypothetical protein GCM10010917_43290 [Paenibacillus physcomitrellae]|uniref:Uncharacterized protein n=2 Tax=Bacteria TaxID=2 RepID=A0ABQ2CAT0_9DEIO|nr:hypothetical protein GCM10010917_43290 [Paenibacillus physcomitrellae]GGB84230.1 hypothetical protein GCM10008019_45320 [Deinococcus soli (ex Cha et al. 2016)]GGI69207.1 hypothetical protein GCM10008021_31730 [Deinococcus wulumuqiensis]GGJ33154.1 hypothetical protein GCM10008022_47360 [Paenibacillus hunanensis]